MPDPRPEGRPGAAGVYDRPKRRIPWTLVAAGAVLSAGAAAFVLWLT